MARSVITPPGYRSALRLKELLGPNLVRRIRMGDHPLTAGLNALERRLLPGPALSDSEIERASAVDLLAQELAAFEDDWTPYQRRLVGELTRKQSCEAIQFEMRVSTHALRPVARSVTWTRYLPALGDFRTTEPDLVVECKLVRTPKGPFRSASDTRHQILRQLSTAKDQVPSTGVPYVVAVGFNEAFSSTQSEDVVAAVERSEEWFEAHPEVSALVIFTPRQLANSRAEVMGLIGRLTDFGNMVQVTNNRATYPLPVGLLLRADGYIASELRTKLEGTQS